MGLLNIFSSKDPEDYELKGDKLVETGAHGKAIGEYEHALERLEKTAPWDDGFRQSLREKIHSCRETLVLQNIALSWSRGLGELRKKLKSCAVI